MPQTYDLIVVGGGPAGATLASLVARAGHRVLLLERTRFPRYQIGESLLPATFNGVFELLGIRERVEATGTPVLKRGATFRWGTDSALWTMNFGGAPDDTAPGPDWPTAFNVRRDEFDAALLDAAREAGVDVREDARVVGFDLRDGRVHGAEVRDREGQWSAAARWTAGATGQASPLAALIGRRQPSGFFRNAAVFSYFHGAKRLPPPLEGNVLLESFDDGWAWYIPLSDTLTSVGVVLYHPAVPRLRGDHEGVYLDCLARCPYSHELLQGAELVREGMFSGMRVRREFSYANDRFWIPGALVVGDSACFIDVILSSGVHLATFGALQAARAINSALSGEIPERLAMNEFELRYRLEFTKFYQGLVGLHDMGHDGATYRGWLREMLQRTQGVFLDDEPELAPGDRQKTWRATAYLRRHNAAMVADTSPPSIARLAPIPDVHGELTVSDDRLHWRRAHD